MNSVWKTFFGLMGWWGLVVLVTSCAPPRQMGQSPATAPAIVEKPPILSTWGPTVLERSKALQAVSWSEIIAWRQEDPRPALGAFLKSCESLSRRNAWAGVCAKAKRCDISDKGAVQHFFQEHFVPHRVINEDGGHQGLVTGYYVPELEGSLVQTSRFRHPVYGRPADLLVVDLASIHPTLSNYGLRGRVEGQRLVPYWTRSEIDSGQVRLPAPVLCYVEDPVDLFFLQVQGSGRIILTNGETMIVNYAEQNGHPYSSIGRLLLDRGEMTPNQMSMQNIKAWGQRNPDKVLQLLAENPRYIFFRRLEGGMQMPPGAQGIPLTSGYSLAVDPRTTPLGAPVFISTFWPNSTKPLHRLMVAQDTGGAIKGPVRADFFWGMGNDAGDMAGRMKQGGRMWVLLPKGSLPGS